MRPLASAKDTNLRTREIRDIAQAIERATAEYGDKLERWLNRLLPTKLDEGIIGGGAASIWSRNWRFISTVKLLLLMSLGLVGVHKKR